MTPSVLHVSTYATGGAGRAAARLHQAMVSADVDSTMLTGSGWRFRTARQAERRLRELQKSDWLTWRSAARFGSGLVDSINSSPADVVNLHWITDGLLSVEDIGRIEKPLVWTMHDMWAFTGTEHYAPEEPTPTRWQQGYTKTNRPTGDSGPDLDRWTWQRKRQAWTDDIHLVPVSHWLQRSASASPLAGRWPSTVIPNVMDTDTFAPAAGTQTPDNPVIAFISSAGISDERKGWQLLVQALPKVQERFPDVTVMVIGQGDPREQAQVQHNVQWMGQVTQDSRIAELLRSADVVAVPSLADNLPMTACEAQCVGKAVVAFDVGGLADTLDHLATGYLAQPFDVDDYAHGLITAIEDSRGMNHWGQAARARATHAWSPEIVVDRYLDLYEQVLG